MKLSCLKRQFGVGEGIHNSRGLAPAPCSQKPRIQIQIQMCTDGCSKILLRFSPPRYYPNLLYFSPCLQLPDGSLYIHDLPIPQMHFLSGVPRLSPQSPLPAPITAAPHLSLYWLEVPLFQLSPARNLGCPFGTFLS